MIQEFVGHVYINKSSCGTVAAMLMLQVLKFSTNLQDKIFNCIFYKYILHSNDEQRNKKNE